MRLLKVFVFIGIFACSWAVYFWRLGDALLAYLCFASAVAQLLLFWGEWYAALSRHTLISAEMIVSVTISVFCGLLTGGSASGAMQCYTANILLCLLLYSDPISAMRAAFVISTAFPLYLVVCHLLGPEYIDSINYLKSDDDKKGHILATTVGLFSFALFFVVMHARSVAKSLRDREMFAALVAHELKTPLAAMNDMLELQRQAKMQGRADHEDYGQDLMRACGALTEMVEDLLSYSRLNDQARRGGGGGVGEFGVDTHFDLVEMLRETMGVARFANLVGPNVTLSLEFADGIDEDDAVLSALHGRARALKQCILVLTQNACKFTRRGFVTLCVSYALRDDADVDLAVSVRDSGIGIDEASRRHIFEPFYRAGSVLTSEYSGSGLGLSVLKGLVETQLRNGRVDVESAVGVGSTFTIACTMSYDQAKGSTTTTTTTTTTPTTEQESSVAPTLRRRRSRSSTGGEATPDATHAASVGRGRALLLVDDSALLLKISARALRRLGFRVVTATDGVEALEKFREHAASDTCFSLIVVDYMMPQLTGLEASREMRRVERERSLARCPIVILSALGEYESKDGTADIDAWVSKTDSSTRSSDRWLHIASFAR